MTITDTDDSRTADLASRVQPLVKVCGITEERDARMCVRAGVDWIGINFWPESRRYVDARDRHHGRAIADAIRDEHARMVEERAAPAQPAPSVQPVHIVGLFVNQPEGKVARIAEYVGLDHVQLHGDETERTCEVFSQAGFSVIKAMGLGSAADVARLAGYPCEYVLADTPSQGYGGSGRVFDWSLATQLATRLADRPGKRVILAGGLTPDNVADAIAAVAPYGVDVASGVESAPGIKDPDLVAAFLAAARG